MHLLGYIKRWLPLPVAALCVTLASCYPDPGQMAGGGIGGTGITSGTITGFGSVFVNGIEFETAGAIRVVDDVQTQSSGTDDAAYLDAGMVVTVRGTVNPDGVSGVATEISYDVAIRGPIATPPVEDADAVFKVFDVLGTAVRVDRNATVFVATDYQSLQMQDVVEVSGYYDTAGILQATRIVGAGTYDRDTIVEVRGEVEDFDGIATFTIGTLAVTFDGATVFEGLPGSVANGQYVEVNGLLQGAAVLVATRIQHDDSEVEYYSGAISIEGLVSGYADPGNFSVNGVPVDATGATYSPAGLAATLGDNQLIEVDGLIAAGRITAIRIEQRGGDVKLAGVVAGSDAARGMLSVDVVPGQESVAVTVDLQTQLEDELAQVAPFTLAQLSPGDPVTVQGFLDAAGGVVAARIRRRSLEGHVLAGPVTAATGTAAGGSITILGVTMLTDRNTEFEDGDDGQFQGGGDDFYATVLPGAMVELEDGLPVDGVADEVELGN
ncbi:MAG: DUF5666 domain-containing protein [Pseudomonadota bacterium]